MLTNKTSTRGVPGPGFLSLGHSQRCYGPVDFSRGRWLPSNCWNGSGNSRPPARMAPSRRKPTSKPGRICASRMTRGPGGRWILPPAACSSTIRPKQSGAPPAFPEESRLPAPHSLHPAPALLRLPPLKNLLPSEPPPPPVLPGQKFLVSSWDGRSLWVASSSRKGVGPY